MKLTLIWDKVYAPSGGGIGGGGELPDKSPEARGHLQPLGSENLGGRWAESAVVGWRRKWLQPDRHVSRLLLIQRARGAPRAKRSSNKLEPS